MRPLIMQVKLRLFGQLKESVGFAERWCEVLDGASVSDLVATLADRCALPEAMLVVSAFAVNHEYVPAQFLLSDGDEVAILPPVSGGAA